MKESQAWRIQVRSDLIANGRLLDRSDASTYCQSIAKCQQVVEKSIKMLVAVLIDQQVIDRLSRPVDRGHLLTRHIAVLRKMPRAAGPNLPQHIADMLNDFRRGEIAAISLLAPAYPEGDTLFRPNTEYPYNQNNQPNDWTAPASEDSYKLDEVDRFVRLAQEIADKADRFYLAAQTMPRVQH